MPREHAVIHVKVWNKDHWRALPREAQHLYFVLLTDPKLSYCGVADWRPGRIAARADRWTAGEVIDAAQILQERGLIVIDEDTEEVLIVSFIRNDGLGEGGLMGQPKMAVSMANAYGVVASNVIRGVIVHELHRWQAERPELPGWKPQQVISVMTNNAIDPAALAHASLGVTPPFTPAVTPGFTPPVTPPEPDGDPSDYPSGYPSPTTATATTTSPHLHITAGAAQARPSPPTSTTRGTRIPEHFGITDDMRDWAKTHTPGVDVDRSTAMFVNHFVSKPGKDGTRLDWSRTWQNWLMKDHQALVKANGNGQSRYFGSPGSGRMRSMQ